MRFRRIMIAVMVVLVVMCNLNITAFAAFEELNVPQYTQENTNWCWVAAAQMAGKYKYSASTRTQTQIVEYITGSSTMNDPGTIWQTANATEYVTNNTYNLSAALLSTWSWEKIKTSIDNGYPVIALVRSNGSGHYYVIRGYDPTTNKIAVNDPADGTRYTCAWEEFCEGTWNHESRAYHSTVYFSDYND